MVKLYEQGGMRMLKKYSLKILVLLCAVSLLAMGCKNSGKTQIEEETKKRAFSEPRYEWGTIKNQTLTVWGRETDLERSYMKKAFARYEELTGNKIKTVPFSPEKFENEVKKAFQEGKKEPDLLLSFGGTNIDSFQPEKNLYDFTDAPWVDDLTDNSINQTIYHGKIVGLPHWEAAISGTIYNKKLLKKLKIDIPKNQKEFLKVCQILLENDIIPLYIPCKDSSMLLYQFPLDTIVENVETLTNLNNGKIGYADLPSMKKIVEWYCSMAKSGYLGDNFLDNNWDGMSDALKSEKYAMLLCWDSWLYTDFTGEPSDFGLMPAYMGIPENGTFEGPNLSLMMVNKNSPQLKGAIDLVTFMADPYNYNVAFEGIYTAPVFKDQLTKISTPQYVEASNWIEKNYHNSIAWLRIRGFSQTDATCIIDCMKEKKGYTIEQCLEDMDKLRMERIEP